MNVKKTNPVVNTNRMYLNIGDICLIKRVNALLPF